MMRCEGTKCPFVYFFEMHTLFHSLLMRIWEFVCAQCYCEQGGGMQSAKDPISLHGLLSKKKTTLPQLKSEGIGDCQRDGLHDC